MLFNMSYNIEKVFCGQGFALPRITQTRSCDMVALCIWVVKRRRHSKLIIKKAYTDKPTQSAKHQSVSAQIQACSNKSRGPLSGPAGAQGVPASRQRFSIAQAMVQTLRQIGEGYLDTHSSTMPDLVQATLSQRIGRGTTVGKKIREDLTMH